MAICTAHWSGGTTLATLAQTSKSYSYVWRFTRSISYLIQSYCLAVLEMHGRLHHQPEKDVSIDGDIVLSSYQLSTQMAAFIHEQGQRLNTLIKHKSKEKGIRGIAMEMIQLIVE